MIEFEIIDQAWAQELQAGVAEYLDELIFGVDADYDDDEEPRDTETGLPFCGCDVCYWREVLAYVTPRVMLAAEKGQVVLVKGDPDANLPAVF